MIKNIAEPLQQLLQTAEPYEPEITHYFSEGICIREMRVKAGALIIGASHKTDHLTIVSHGTMQIRIGDESKLVQAPYTFEALAGSRKIGFAYTECVVSNIIPTDSRDIEEIEREFTTLHEDREALQKTLKEIS